MKRLTLRIVALVAAMLLVTSGVFSAVAIVNAPIASASHAEELEEEDELRVEDEEDVDIDEAEEIEVDEEFDFDVQEELEVVEGDEEDEELENIEIEGEDALEIGEDEELDQDIDEIDEIVIGGDEFIDEEDEEDSEFDIGITLFDIVQDPLDFFGRTVTISGEVEEIIGEQTFVLGDDGEHLLIVLPPDVELAELGQGQVASLAVGDTVQVTGPVTDFDLFDIQRDFNVAFDADEELQLDAFDGDPAVVARLLNLEPSLSAGARTVIDLQDILEDPEAFEGVVVDVAGQVSDVVTRESFVLEEADLVDAADELAADELAADELAVDEILVVTFEGNIPRTVIPEAFVAVTGVVFNDFTIVDIEREFGFDIEEEDIFDEFTGHAVIVATEVRTEGAVIEAVDLDDILADADAFEDQLVAIEGEIQDILTTEAFVFEDDGEEILVILDEQVTLRGDLEEEIAVEVTGVVVDEFIVTDIEADFGLIFEDAEDVEVFEGQPAIVATRILTVSEEAPFVDEDLEEDPEDVFIPEPTNRRP